MELSINNNCHYNTTKSENSIGFKGLSPKIVTKTIYPEVMTNAMNKACASVIAELTMRKDVLNESKKFIYIREKYTPEYYEAFRNEEKTAWDFFINSNPDTMNTFEKAQDKITVLFSNKKVYDEFSKIDSSKLNKHEQKQLKFIMKNFNERLGSGTEFKKLINKENEIARKYNSYIPTIDGKETSKVEITKILQTEKNEEIRQKAYDATIKGGDLIADDMIELVKMRNNFAKSKGYKNYFDYNLKEAFDVDAKDLDKLLDEVYSGVQSKILISQTKSSNELKKMFGVEKLEGYHYGYLTDSNPQKAINQILENNSIEDISKKTYNGMGYDVDKLLKNGNLTLDLYPRKNKNTHGFSFCIKHGEDTRILANLRNDINSLDTLNHEMGHSVYDLGISTKLTPLDRDFSSMAVTEAISMMMQDLSRKENILQDIIPKDKLEKFKNSFKDDEIDFITKSLLIINFERNFYKNPNQNPAKLWADLRLKYRNKNYTPDNEWATIPHYLSHPAYYQNYFRASLMKVQIYNHLKKVLGNITENKNTSKYLNDNIFSKGASIEEYDLIKQLTGKKFSPKDYIESLNQ